MIILYCLQIEKKTHGNVTSNTKIFLDYVFLNIYQLDNYYKNIFSVWILWIQITINRIYTHLTKWMVRCKKKKCGQTCCDTTAASTQTWASTLYEQLPWKSSALKPVWDCIDLRNYSLL